MRLPRGHFAVRNRDSLVLPRLDLVLKAPPLHRYIVVDGPPPEIHRHRQRPVLEIPEDRRCGCRHEMPVVRRDVERIPLAEAAGEHRKVDAVWPGALRDSAIRLRRPEGVHCALVARTFFLRPRSHTRSAKVGAVTVVGGHGRQEPLILRRKSCSLQDVSLPWGNQHDLLFASNHAVEVLHAVAMETTVDHWVIAGLGHCLVAPGRVGYPPRPAVRHPDPRRVRLAPAGHQLLRLRSEVFLHRARQGVGVVREVEGQRH
mmetsp:Transcript_4534/g.9350  ORF Transcript_4534/g.9350 Transcript_4534/m.9350 type:complete len:259 (-) Transcript_4534:469-1245(-)